MEWPKQRIFLLLFVFLLLSLPLFSQTNDSQTTWVKRAVDDNTFTGKVVGISDGDTIKVMREARAAKRGLWADKNPIPPWEWRRIERGRRKR